MEKHNAVLLLCTGGTISMSEDPVTGALRPVNFEKIFDYLPELNKIGIRTDSIAFDPLIDSSDVDPSIWSKLAHIIYDHYHQYDGFVVLHGTDTMAYSASALSFMLNNL
ncbi:MAG TPA: asparaginase, partial [Bacteroidales bacterium]|nr:asparaginase [Bacteroidales bacterium]HPL07019.1 asparaginase [Bacteroidales bacterium]